jgi:hypothetical protein
MSQETAGAPDFADGGRIGDAAAEHRAAVAAILARGAITFEDLWLRYFGLGGYADALEVEAYLRGLMPLPAGQRDVLAQAANERLDDIAGRRRVPYSRPLRGPAPETGPLAALVHLLRAAPQALAGRLGESASAAGRLLSLDVSAYLVDYDQRFLVAVPGSDLDPEQIPIEGTLAGRAFQSGIVQPATSDPQPRLWVPLLDGVERLGVLDVRVSSSTELADLYLQEQCAWVASLFAHLISGATTHGDRVDAVRRNRPRTSSAELIWKLLPPFAAASEQFSIAGLLEPAHEVGGDGFDYALGEDRVQLAVFDGMGHSLRAGLIAAAALSAYRAARRAGEGLYAQAAAIDDAIAPHFSEAFATGVLAELDLTTGRLRYVGAGHPAPLLLRDGKVVSTLDQGRRLPFGLGWDAGGLTIGEASLQPGDWLVFYTDGITEARAADGELFGSNRLIDFVEREAAGGLPPAETTRRLIHAVLRHQEGELQDDATVLLARWAPGPSTPPPPTGLITPG